MKLCMYMYQYIRSLCMHMQGLVKPDIVFFGEDLPQRFYSLRLPDFSHCDLLIVMGTSLEVRTLFQLYCDIWSKKDLINP